MVAGERDEVRTQRLRHETRKTNLHEFDYRRVLCGKEAVEWSVSKEVKLAGEEMLRRRELGDRVRRLDECSRLKLLIFGTK